MKKICVLAILLCFIPLQSVDFDSSMETPKGAYLKPIEYAKVWRYIYNRNIKLLGSLNSTKTPRIPKIIHQIWLGGNLPSQYHALCETWQKNHPDWLYKLWTDADIESFGMVNKKLFNMSKNYGYQSDLLRYEILYRFGGVYVDIDFESIRALDELHDAYSLYSCLIPGGAYLANGVIGVEPKHPVMEQCILQARSPRSDRDYEDIMTASGPYLFSRCLFNFAILQDQSIMILPSSFFFPFPSNMRYQLRASSITREKARSFAKPETYAVHYWANSWQK